MYQFTAFFKEGFFHILSINGADHILFLLAVIVIYRLQDLKQIAAVTLSFTIAHSLTLALTVFNVICIPASVIELLIAATILFTCIENVLLTKLQAHRVFTTGFFGLIHGMGFSMHLKELFIGMQFNVLETLLPFNLGLELSQLLILISFLLIMLLLEKIFGFRQKTFIYGISLSTAIIAIYWLIERSYFAYFS